MPLRGATVREYLKSIREVETIAGATEHTYRAALTTFLTKAAAELDFGAISVRSELRLASVGQPDMQVVDAAGSAIGYGETKIPGTASRERFHGCIASSTAASCTGIRRCWDAHVWP